MLEIIMILLPSLISIIICTVIFFFGIYLGENNKRSKTVYVVVDSLSVSGGVCLGAHVHTTKSSAEKFMKENQENDPSSTFVLRECIVYDCEK